MTGWGRFRVVPEDGFGDGAGPVGVWVDRTSDLKILWSGPDLTAGCVVLALAAQALIGRIPIRAVPETTASNDEGTVASTIHDH